MILLTVGTQLSFDRLVRAVDEWCAGSGRSDVVGQIGDVGHKGYRPRHFEWERFMSPARYRSLAEQAEVIVAHAGMGSIITAFELGKPIVVMPRRAALGEHRNDHQQATVAHLSPRSRIYVAADETQLAPTLAQALSEQAGPRTPQLGEADPNLVASLRRAILSGTVELESATYAQTDWPAAQDG